MPISGSMEHVFALAIQAEQNAEVFYERLAALFHFYPEVAQFWKEKAREEVEHAKVLEKLCARQSAEKLSQPIDARIVEDATRAATIELDPLVDQIRTLQDAYQTANRIENAETNAIFEFLVETCADESEVKVFLREYLLKHVNSLMLDFPGQFGTGTLRRGIMAQHNSEPVED